MEIVLSGSCFAEFLKLIHQLTGITISANRTSMIEGRLRRRVLALNLSSYEDYLNRVRTDKTEEAQFIDLVTTNETYFFRTPRIWEYLETRFLPAWARENPGTSLKIWSAAASSGEEAHSLGVICQAFRESHPAFSYQILGTDISGEMVELCQKGEYSGRSIEAFRQTRGSLFERYMRPVSEFSYQADPEIRKRLRFQRHNLFSSLESREKFDLVLLRNVLIYFKGEDQEKVLSLIAARLSEKGLLVIGESESLSHIQVPFRHEEPLIYRPLPSSSAQRKAG